jgi:hypothetical protein
MPPMIGEMFKMMRGSSSSAKGERFAMYRWVYWSGITLLVVWTVLSAYSAIGGI